MELDTVRSGGMMVPGRPDRVGPCRAAGKLSFVSGVRCELA